MSSRKRSELARDPRGYFKRDLGWKASGGRVVQHRFLLGRDEDQARLRNLQLERVWAAVEARWEDMRASGAEEVRRKAGERPLWDRVTLQIAQAAAAGEAVARVELFPGGHAHEDPADRERSIFIDLVELDKLQMQFRFIRLELADQSRHQEGRRILAGLHAGPDAARKEQTRQAKAEVGPLLGDWPAEDQTLHQALEAYADWVRSNYLAPGGEGRVSQYGVTVLTYVGLLKEHHADVPLTRFGLAELEAVLTYWRNRPQGKRGRPVALDTARDMIKRIRHFARWLHRSPAFRWRKPDDWEDAPVRVGLTHEEKSRKFSPAQVETYTLDELCVLFEYATPWERSLMLLALNCGFGRGEIESLTTEELQLRTSHGHYDRSGSWVRRLRFKSTVYGEWSLWDETVQGVEWLLARRGKTEQRALLLTETGRPLGDPTAGNNRNNLIPNAWGRLLKRIRKDHGQFRRLSFNKLRKTAGDLVRQFSDGETASVFLSHGTPCRADNLLDVYTNRDFKKVFNALDAVRRHLAPMFARVAVAFPAADASEERPSLSRGTINRIRRLRQEGHTVAKVAEIVGVSEGTVRRYCRARKAT